MERTRRHAVPRPFLVAAGLVLIGLAAPAAPARGGGYDLYPVDPSAAYPGAGDALLVGMNASGQAVGNALDADGIQRAFLWQLDPTTGAPEIVPIDHAPGGYTRAIAIDDAGRVIGVSGPHAFVWTRAEGALDLPPLDLDPVDPDYDERAPVGITAAGDIAGWSHNAWHDRRQAVLWRRVDGAYVAVAIHPEAGASEARGVAGAGLVFGIASDGPAHSVVQTGWVWDADAPAEPVVPVEIDNPVPDSTWLQPIAMTPDGQVVGTIAGPEGGFVAFSWDGIDTTLVADPGQAHQVTDAGHMLGALGDATPFVWLGDPAAAPLAITGGGTPTAGAIATSDDGRALVTGALWIGGGLIHAHRWSSQDGVAADLFGASCGLVSAGLDVHPDGTVVGVFAPLDGSPGAAFVTSPSGLLALAPAGAATASATVITDAGWIVGTWTALGSGATRPFVAVPSAGGAAGVPLPAEQPPVAVCQPATVAMAADGSISFDPAILDGGSISSCALAFTIPQAELDALALGPNAVTLVVTDPLGRDDTCDAVVTVIDQIAPIITCPAAVAATTAQGEASASVSLGTASATDNAGPGGVTITRDGPSDATFPIGDHVVTWTATDASGNAATCAQAVAVGDGGGNLFCKAATVTLDAAHAGALAPADVFGGTSSGTVVSGLVVSPATFGCGDLGAVVVTLSGTRGDGGAVSCQATVTVADLAPTAVCRAAALTVSAGSTALEPTWVDGGSIAGCGTVTVTPGAFSLDDVGLRTVAVVATNGDGASASCEASVSVRAEGDLVWDVIDLDPSGVFDAPGTIEAVGMNEAGQVAGTYKPQLGGLPFAFVWELVDGEPVMTSLGSFEPIGGTVAKALDEDGRVIGYRGIEGAAFLWEAGTFVRLAPLAGDYYALATAIGAGGVVVGSSMNDTMVRAVRWAPPTYTPTLLLGDRSEAWGINDAGMIHGVKRDPETSLVSGTWFWSGATGTILLPNPTVPTGSVLEPVSMNASGRIVGVAKSGSTTRAFAWSPGDAAATLLETTGSRATDVGDDGLVLGYSDGGGAFTWGGDASAPTLLGALPASPTYLTRETFVDGDFLWGTAMTVSFLARPFFRADDGALAEPFASTCRIQRGYSHDANTSGVLTGSYHPADAAHRRRAWAWSGASLQRLDLPGAFDIYPRSANEAGWIHGDWWPQGDPQVSSHGLQRTFVARPVGDGPLLGSPSTALAEPAPVAVCGTTTVALGASGTGTLAFATQLDAGSTGCIASYEASRTTFDASDLGPTPVTLTITDTFGRQASCTATVNVVDTLRPTITACAPNATGRTDPGATSVAIALGAPQAFDNVAIAGVSNNAPATFPIGTTIVRWEVVDTSGNLTTCNQSVTVVEGGDLLCWATTIVLDDGAASVEPAMIHAGSTAGATFSDLAVSPSALGCDDVGMRTLTLTGTRDDGAAGSCQAAVTVVDPSQAQCRTAILTLGDDGTATLTPDMVDDDTGGCGAFTLSREVFDEADLGMASVTLSYVNGSGGESSCEAPVYVFGALEADCEPATVSLVDGVGVVRPAALVTTTMDPYVEVSVTPEVFGCADIGEREVTVTVLDALGRTTSCTSTVEVTIAAEQLVASDLGAGVEPIARDAAGRILFARDGQAWIWDAGVVTQVAPGYLGVEATGMNASGQVVGTVMNDAYESRAFVWHDGALALLSDPAEPASYGTAINDAGQAVGYVFGATRRAFVWHDGARAWLDEGAPGGTAPIAINDAGDVIGHLEVDLGDGVIERRVFFRGPLVDGGTPTFVDLGAVPEGARVALAASGQVMLALEGETLVWRPGDPAPEPLDSALPTQSFMQSADGRIVGYDAAGAAFVWADGVRTPLPGTGGDALTVALGVNAGGDAVGLEIDLETGAGQVLLWVGGAGAPLVVAPFVFGPLDELGFPRIADDGVVYGLDAANRAWAWRDGALFDLTPSGGTMSVVLGVADGVAWGAWGDGEPTNGFVTRLVSGAPTLVAPATLEAPSDLGACAATLAIPVEATDACGSATVTWSGHAEGAPFPVGATEVVLTATGASGLTTTHTVIVTVEDDEAPVVTPIGGDAVTFDCATPAWVDPGATVVDNCDVGLVALVSGGVDVAAPGTTTLTYTASDARGNAAAPATRVVTVGDGDGDETADCQDGCPADGDKTEPGLCGCGVSEEACADGCPDDPLKTEPGVCGCGTPDADGNGNGLPDCLDGCAAAPVVVADPGDTTLVADACRSTDGGCGGKRKRSGDRAVATVPSLVDEVEAVDDCGGVATVTQEPAPGTELDVGDHTLTFTVSGAGGVTTIVRALTVVAGVALEYMPPLANDQTRAFTVGRVVPVKVRVRTPCGRDLAPLVQAGLRATLEVVELDEQDPDYVRHIRETQPNGWPILWLAPTGNHFHADLATPRATFTTTKPSRYFRVRVTVTSVDGAVLMGRADAYLEPRSR
ncbi:MAG: HYR domain-containing protein [Deltaproteobacteria bacterium]|nr:HYR domain-containing protein [Deltaproteobacteria bacterium]